MILLRSAEDLRAWRNHLRSEGKRVGLVPTMGYLHEGHLSHLRALHNHVDEIVTSIFVNPTQFAANEDLGEYPRDLDGDIAKLESVGGSAVFFPEDSEMYPEHFSTYVHVENMTTKYEGEFRPTHFRGVTTVVCKLLNIVQPEVVTFGQKDAQQVAVVKRMVRDLNLDVEILVIPIIREEDGIAMSSRNVYLSEEERRSALSLSKALKVGQAFFREGNSLEETLEKMKSELASGVRLNYLAIVHPDTFMLADKTTEHPLAIIAGNLGTTRLLDNISLSEVRL